MANNVLLTLSLQSPRRDGRRADSVVAGFVFTPRGGDFTRLKMGELDRGRDIFVRWYFPFCGEKTLKKRTVLRSTTKIDH